MGVTPLDIIRISATESSWDASDRPLWTGLNVSRFNQRLSVSRTAKGLSPTPVLLRYHSLPVGLNIYPAQWVKRNLPKYIACTGYSTQDRPDDLPLLAIRRTMKINSRPTEIITYFWK